MTPEEEALASIDQAMQGVHGDMLRAAPPVARIDLWRRNNGGILAVVSKNSQESFARVEGEPVNLAQGAPTAQRALEGLYPWLDRLIEQERED